MRMRIQVIIESDNHDIPVTEEVACIQRADLAQETLGLTLDEAKDLLTNVQARMVKEQTGEYIEQQRRCPLCGRASVHWQNAYQNGLLLNCSIFRPNGHP